MESSRVQCQVHGILRYRDSGFKCLVQNIHHIYSISAKKCGEVAVHPFKEFCRCCPCGGLQF